MYKLIILSWQRWSPSRWLQCPGRWSGVPFGQGWRGIGPLADPPPRSGGGGRRDTHTVWAAL